MANIEITKKFVRRRDVIQFVYGQIIERLLGLDAGGTLQIRRG
jgi:hypothetical protein